MQDKSKVRKELLRKRDNIPPEVRSHKDRVIQENIILLDQFRNASAILFFASFKSEFHTTELIRLSLSGGRRVFLPKVDSEKHELSLYAIRDFSELTPGCMGIPEPPGQENPAGINEIDLVIIPGAGFDPSGNRIGYGGGYYDKLLSGLQKHVPIIAPAYEEQIVDSIPTEPHDIRVNMIVTDRRVIQCGP
jgi:5-formyltetrahydrofolate cyclo-ligase